MNRLIDLLAKMASPHAAQDFSERSEAALQLADDAFLVEVTALFQGPEHGRVFAHGGFVPLLDADSALLTLILDVDQAGRIARGYLTRG